MLERSKNLVVREAERLANAYGQVGVDDAWSVCVYMAHSAKTTDDLFEVIKGLYDLLVVNAFEGDLIDAPCKIVKALRWSSALRRHCLGDEERKARVERLKETLAAR